MKPKQLVDLILPWYKTHLENTEAGFRKAFGDNIRDQNAEYFAYYVNSGYIKLFSVDKFQRYWQSFGQKFICLGHRNDSLQERIKETLADKGYIHFEEGLQLAYDEILKNINTIDITLLKEYQDLENLQFDSFEDEAQFYVLACITIVNESPATFSEIAYIVPELYLFDDTITYFEFQNLLKFAPKSKRPINLIFR